MEAWKDEKTAIDVGITVDILKEGADMVTERLTKVFSEYLRALKVPIDQNKGRHNPDPPNGQYRNIYNLRGSIQASCLRT